MKKDKEYNLKTEYEEKVQDIKRRKRALRNIEDPKKVKKIKEDLKREQRGAKRSERKNVNDYIKQEIDKFKGE